MPTADLRTKLRRAVEVLNQAEIVAISCHISPDGDALGSALALARSADLAGKELVVSFAEPFELPQSLDFMPLDLLVPPAEFPARPEVMIVFDAAGRDRLGAFAEASLAAETLIVVDHHVSNEGFGDIDIIDPAAGASAQLAYYLIRELDWPIDPVVATCLHAGLVTDTGRFQYSNTSAEVLRIAATLLEAGAEPARIGQAIYEGVPFGYLKVAAAVMGRAVLEPELSLVWSVLKQDDLDDAGVEYADAEGLIDYVRIAKEADVAVLLKEVDGVTKASLRSRNVVDVDALARHLGGGGHARASGFTHAGAPDEVIQLIRQQLADD